jgi:transcriptional regulator GlxA family with amidase domain
MPQMVPPPVTTLNSKVTVVCRGGDVANAWGFWHMGQFARNYKRQFGELPSERYRRHSGSP